MTKELLKCGPSSLLVYTTLHRAMASLYVYTTPCDDLGSKVTEESRSWLMMILDKDGDDDDDLFVCLFAYDH